MLSSIPDSTANHPWISSRRSGHANYFTIIDAKIPVTMTYGFVPELTASLLRLVTTKLTCSQ